MAPEAEAQAPSAGGVETLPVSLPKGGGAIRSIGEKFAFNPATGTGSFSVPVEVSPGRSGFGPQLALTYNSGAGNGHLGMGWDLAVPSIARKIEDSVPRYDDADESDVFLLSGAEDLVPLLEPVKVAGRWSWRRPQPTSRSEDGVDYMVERFRPRTEGPFTRTERWTRTDTGEAHWRTISTSNVTSIYGRDNNSRVFDPDDLDPGHPTRVFSWLLGESYDDRGNVIRYEYKAENSGGVDTAAAHESNRTPQRRAANRYLKHVRYGNRESRLVSNDPDLGGFMFQIVFDYGEHDADDPKPGEGDGAGAESWVCRRDPFSQFKPGFERRWYRLCQRILTFHHFPGEQDVGDDCLVRALAFKYTGPDDVGADPREGHPVASFLASITSVGYRRNGNAYVRRTLPPLEFEYARPVISERIEEMDAESLENLPVGASGGYQWTDLDGEGLSGILTEQDGAMYYKRNLGGGRLGPLEEMRSRPSTAALATGQQLMDLDGDGRLELVALGAEGGSAVFERTSDGDWAPMRRLLRVPNVDWTDRNLKFIDLTGDGRPDVMITEHDAITWYESVGEDGFAAAARVAKALDEEAGPALVFADGSESIHIADMTGDGLADLVRVRNGEFCFWPNRGRGSFGKRVTLDASPWFDEPERFDHTRVRFADIDGSGPSDLVYLGAGGVDLYVNRSGNSFAPARRLEQVPHVPDPDAVSVVDLLGNGTTCLVWSSSLPADSGRQLRYVELMGGVKPHLLTRVRNNLGAETRVSYASSTKFYLQDKAAGRPWLTTLPFPVHVVERVETIDYVARNRFVSRTSYHHGYYDGEEREFRGFGLAQQLDTEEFATFSTSDALPAAQNVDAASHVPPVLTKTWFHTGALVEGERIEERFAAEWFDEPDASNGSPALRRQQLDAPSLPPSPLPRSIRVDDNGADVDVPVDLSGDEAVEAVRALRGSILRREVYAIDGGKGAALPYSVAQRNYTVELLQPRGDNEHTVNYVHARESVELQYDRKLYDVGSKQLPDPRVSHSVTLEVDRYGNALRSAAVNYGRRHADMSLPGADRAVQTRVHVTCTESRYTNPVEEHGAYRRPAACEVRTFEVMAAAPAGTVPRTTNLFRFEELRDVLDGAPEVPYTFADPGDGVARRRLIEHVRTVFRRDNLTGALPPGELERLALPHTDYKRAFTPQLLQRIYLDPGALRTGGNVLNAARMQALMTDAGYVHSEGDANWWIPSSRVFYSPVNDTPGDELAFASANFFMVHRIVDQFGIESTVRYDTHNLIALESRDAAGNKVTAGDRAANGAITPRIDYRVLKPRLVTDANGNRSEVLYDALGMVTATAVMGKQNENLGDSLAGVPADLIDAQIDAVFAAADPVAAARPLLGTASSRAIYDPHRFMRTAAANPNDIDKWIAAYSATVSRVTHASEPQPPGGSRLQMVFSYSDGLGSEVQRKALAAPDRAAPAVARWNTSGWSIRNNKNLVVRAYEPFFDVSHKFMFGRREGVSVVRLYDPVGRLVAVLHPDHAWEKTVYEPWRQVRFDAADTVHPEQRYAPATPGVFPPDDFDPADDADVGEHFARLPQDEYLPTWYRGRMNAAAASQLWPDVDPTTGAAIPGNAVVRARERAAAQQSGRHAATPAVTDSDPLGRGFREVSDNGDDTGGDAHLLITRTEFDIEGNIRAVRDAKRGPGVPLGRRVKTFDYSMLGAVATHAHMDAGRRWMLTDVTGNEHRAWDDRGHEFATEYDALRRPLRRVVRGSDAQQSDPRTLNRNVEFERMEYGEGVARAAQNNLRTRVYRARDAAGIVVNARFDFKGNHAEYSRAIISDYEALPDWSGAVATDAPLASETAYDALNRAVHENTPDGSTIRRAYNMAGQLESVDVNVRGELDANGQPLWTPVVLATDYDAKGRRTRVELGARASVARDPVATEYEYDELTARITRIVTRRDAQDFPGDCPQPPPHGWPGCHIQNLSYTYDAIGNVTQVRDDAQQAIFFRNKRVEPSSEYTYDALYRLIEATGREHLGQAGAAAVPASYSDRPRVGVLHPADGNVVARYTETYTYDDAGNLTELRHRGADPVAPGWTREFKYEEASPLGAGGRNRLTRCPLGALTEAFSTAGDGYDAHGNMLRMPHLQTVAWDFRDLLRTTQRQAMGPGDVEGVAADGERTLYVYGADGRRVRKATELAGGQLKDERIYIGIYERYRRSGGVNSIERETLRIADGIQTVALIETRVAGNEPGVPARMVRFQFGNNVSSASLELGAGARVISYEEYTPYGGTSYQGVASQTDAPKRYRFSGKERDEESGVYYFGARYYAPWLARWISCDPQDAMNRYEYVNGNPVNLVDPDGRNGNPPPIVTGSYGQVGGDHVHQVASMTRSTAAGRHSAALYNQALSVSTSQNSWYADLNGQRVESSLNRAMWGRDYSGTPAPNGRVTLVSSGTSDVGRSVAATASPYFEDVKSFYKLREAGVGPDDALDMVSKSRNQLNQGGVLPQRVPQGPRSAPAALKLGQNVAQLPPAQTTGAVSTAGTTGATATAAGPTSSGGSTAVAAADDIKPPPGAAGAAGVGGKILQGVGVVGAVGGSLAGGIQVGTGIVQVQEGKVGEGAATVTEGTANLGLTIGGAALVKAKVVTTSAGVVGGTATVGAGVLAAGGIALAGEEWRRAVRGEKSAAHEAAEYWADVAVEGESQGGFKGAAKQAAGWTFGFFATLVAVGQGQGPD